MSQPVAPNEVPCLQLLIYGFANGQLVRRLHFRFLPGDESYNYYAGNFFIGRFAPEFAAEARTFVEQHQAAIAPFLLPLSAELAGLRLEDGAAFLKSLHSDQGICLPPAARRGTANCCYVATSTATGECRARVFPTNGPELPEPVVDLLEQFEPFAERVTGAAQIRERQAAQSATRPQDPPADQPPNELEDSPEPKAQRPWWRFW